MPPPSFIDQSTRVLRALTASDGSVTSADIDLGPNPGVMGQKGEIVIEIPAISSTLLASADTLVVAVQTGNSAAPSTAQGFSKTLTGNGSNSAAQEYRFRPPSDIGRYVNVKFTTAGSTGDMSGISAGITFRKD